MFLDDYKSLFKEEIQKILGKEVSLKVNAVFCGEFKLKKQDEELRDEIAKLQKELETETDVEKIKNIENTIVFSLIKLT